MTWSPEEVTQPISCKLCEQESGDLQTYCAHARLTHLSFPVLTIRGSRHAQLLGQRRRNKQHARNGHEREPRVHHWEGRHLGRRGAAKSKAAPTNRQTKRDGGASGSTTVVAKPKADIKVEQSLNKILKAILQTHQTMRDLSSTVSHCGSRRRAPNQTACRNRRRTTQKRFGKRSEDTHEDRKSCGHIWAWSSLCRRGKPRSARERHEAYRRTGPRLEPLLSNQICDEVQAGENVQSGRQENHTEHRVTETFSKHSINPKQSASTDEHRARHGTRATDLSGRSAEDVKITVKTFLAERDVQATTTCRANIYSVWQPLTQNDQSEGERRTLKRRRDGVTRVLDQVDGSISQLTLGAPPGSTLLGSTLLGSTLLGSTGFGPWLAWKKPNN